MAKSKNRVSTKKRILVADDEPWYIQPLVDALEFEGYVIEHSRTGSETVAKIVADEGSVSLLILDLMMNPGEVECFAGSQVLDEMGTRTGLLVLRKIRNEFKISARQLPVICITIVNNPSVESAVKELGVKFFSKTHFKMYDVIEAVRSTIGEP